MTREQKETLIAELRRRYDKGRLIQGLFTSGFFIRRTCPAQTLKDLGLDSGNSLVQLHLMYFSDIGYEYGKNRPHAQTLPPSNFEAVLQYLKELPEEEK